MPSPQRDRESAPRGGHGGVAAGWSGRAGLHSEHRRAVDCVVGPEGGGVGPKELDPCKARGNGAIADTENAAREESLGAALERANAGLATEDLADAKTEAIKTQALLDSLK